MSAMPKIAPPRQKSPPRKQRRLCRSDYEPMVDIVIENPDWLVGAY